MPHSGMLLQKSRPEEVTASQFTDLLLVMISNWMIYWGHMEKLQVMASLSQIGKRIARMASAFFRSSFAKRCKMGQMDTPVSVKKVNVNLMSSFFQKLLGPCPQCCIPSPTSLGLSFPEKKIFKGFLIYMNMAAILVLWPRCGEQTFLTQAHRGFIWNLTLNGPVVSDEKLFDDGRMADRQRTDDGACLYNKLIYEPKGSDELINKKQLCLGQGHNWTFSALKGKIF